MASWKVGAILMSVAISAAAQDSRALLEEALAKTRASGRDLSIRLDRWDAAMRLEAVDAVLQDPLSLPDRLSEWSRALSSASSAPELLRFAQTLLGASFPGEDAGARGTPELAQDRALPPDLRQALLGLSRAVLEAKPLLDKSVGSLSAQERRAVLDTARPILTGREEARPDPEAFAVMARFDRDWLAGAGLILAQAVDRALPLLQRQAPTAENFGRRRWKLGVGDLLVSGPADDAYSAADLEGVALLVDLGGKSRYEAPVAAAGEGEIRLVVDLSREVEARAPEAPSAGSGIFGIGLLYLPNAGGAKRLLAGDFSLGAGLFGLGGLFISGSSSTVEGGRFCQGAGAFGTGVLNVSGDGISYRLRLAGQGFGFTRGVGLFAHRGDRASIDGGQVEPDAREPLAALSLSQGVGYGPRAFAAGGVGLAWVDGKACELRASYMAQGMGYWHALGGLFVSGEANRLQARRYVQGTGVHTGVGALVLQGRGHRQRSWGVGPAFGWDYGIGFLLADGEGHSLASDWASGRGEVNGHGLSVIRGSGHRLALAGLGSGAGKRNAPSYGAAVVRGRDNVVLPPAGGAGVGPLDLSADPWGVLSADAGLRLAPDFSKEPAQWPSVERQARFEEDRSSLRRRLAEADAKPFPERAAGWLFAAASPGLDFPGAIEAAGRLLRLGDEEGSRLFALVSALAFNEFVWLRTLLPAFGGESAARALGRELEAAAGMRRVLLLGFYRHRPVSEAAGLLLDALGSPDWRLRREAAASLGHLLGRQWGQEPGRLRLLETAARLCAPEGGTLLDPAREAEWIDPLAEQSLASLYGVLSLARTLSPSERVALLERNTNPFEPARREALLEWARILRGRPQAYARVVAEELTASASFQDKARAALAEALKDEDQEVVQAALTALGHIGLPEDAPLLAAFLGHESGLLREAAAGGLGRMGDAARAEIRGLSSAASPRTRALGALAAAQTGSAQVLAELPVFWRDVDPWVRRAAVSALSVVANPLRPRRREFIAELRRLEKEDPSSSVRWAATLALASIGP